MSRKPAAYAADSVPPAETWSMVTPADVIRSVRRYWFSAVLVTTLVTVAVVALLVVWPNQYVSHGMMYVRLGRGAMATDPASKSSSSVSMQESRTAEVISIGEMIGSREIAERAVERVGVDEINRPRNWLSQCGSNLSAFLKSDHPLVGWMPKSSKPMGEWSSHQVDAQLERERAIRTVVESVGVTVAKNGYTVVVGGEGDDPFLMQSIVQAVMDEYGRYHVQAHRSEGSLAFFAEQTELSRDGAMLARETLQRTRNEMGWLSPESAETTLRERMIDLERSLNEADSRLAEATSQAAELRSQLEQTEPWVPTKVTLGIANAAGDQLRSQLYDVQVQDGEELSQLSPNHPRYRRLQEKMNQGEDLAQSERADRSERTEAINPVYQELETQFQTVRAQAVGLQSRRDSLREKLAQTKEDFARLNRDMTTLAKLTWEAELAEEIYRDHARSLEEARVHSELDALQMSDVSVIQKATLNLKKSGPPRALLSVIGLLFGLSLGLLQVILRDTSLTTAPVRSGANRLAAQVQRASARTATTPESPPSLRTAPSKRSSVSAVGLATDRDVRAAIPSVPQAKIARVGSFVSESSATLSDSDVEDVTEPSSGGSAPLPR